MVRVLVGYKVRSGADILPILLQLRSSEMSFPGFISSENLQSEEDRLTVVTMSTWQKVADWKAWDTSKLKRAILTQIEGLLADKPRVTVYTIMPTVGWLMR
jgi:heme-degrading monooxygenase HmoA